MEVFHLLSEIKWEAKIGDPYPLAWVTVGAYLLAAIGCIGCAFKAKRIFGKQDLIVHRVVWAGLGVILLFLAVNKQLDLQTLFTMTIKVLAKHWSIYELGRRSQKFFILGLGLISVGSIGWILWKVRRQWKRYILLFVGALFVVRFVVTRAATFYGVGLPSLSVFTGGIKMNWLLELLGALTISAAAFLNIAFSKKGDRVCRK